MRKVASALIWISHPTRSGLIGKSNHLRPIYLKLPHELAEREREREGERGR
jgi:hypothetical protein